MGEYVLIKIAYEEALAFVENFKHMTKEDLGINSDDFDVLVEVWSLMKSKVSIFEYDDLADDSNIYVALLSKDIRKVINMLYRVNTYANNKLTSHYANYLLAKIYQSEIEG